MKKELRDLECRCEETMQHAAQGDKDGKWERG